MIPRIYYKERNGIVQGSREYYIPVRFPYKSKKDLLQDISGCNRDITKIKKKILEKISKVGFEEIVFLRFIPNRIWRKRVTLHHVKETFYHIKKLVTITVKWNSTNSNMNGVTKTQHYLGALNFDGIIEKRLVNMKKMSGSYEVPKIVFRIPHGFQSKDMWIENENLLLTDSIRFILEVWEIWKA